MAASTDLGEARPTLPAGWVSVDVAPIATEDQVTDPEPLEERRYTITGLGRRAWRQSQGLERGPTVAEVMARQGQD